jgi:DinB superfamily
MRLFLFLTVMINLHSNEFASYYSNYIKLVPEQDIVKGLILQKEEMVHFFSSIPVFKHEFRYTEGKWTVKDILLHLIDAERVMSYRALRIARNDKTALPGFEENDYVISARANERDFENLLQEYIIVRNATIILFESFNVEELQLLGIASNSSVSVRAIGYIILGHELHHKQIILEKYL